MTTRVDPVDRWIRGILLLIIIAGASIVPVFLGLALFGGIK